MAAQVADLVAEAARDHPQRPALLDPAAGGTVTWAELERRVATRAGWLRRQGLRRGDRVLLLLANGIAFAEAFWAVLRAGGVVVPTGVSYTAPEIAHLLADSGARLVVTHPATAALARTAGTAAGGGRVVLDALGEGPAVTPGGGASAGDDAVLCYTSGTTGRPKGARLTSASLLANLAAFSDLERLRLQPGDVLLGVLPFFHVFGLNVVLNAAAEAGAAVLCLPRFSPAATVEAMAAHGVTVAYGAPPVYAAFNAVADGTPVSLPSLRAAVSGADALGVDVWGRFAERFGVEVMEGYGLTEASPVVTSNAASPVTRPGTVGHPLPGVRVRLAGDGGEILATSDGPARPGLVGEILVAGPGVFAGYHGQEAATAETLRDGWLATGDLGSFGAGGHLEIAGRLKELVIVSGFNVYPREVERALLAHPAVADAGVVGVPDDRTGERVRAYVVARDGARADREALLRHCRARLARYKVPRELEFVTDLPRTPIGKLRRGALGRSRDGGAPQRKAAGEGTMGKNAVPGAPDGDTG